MEEKSVCDRLDEENEEFQEISSKYVEIQNILKICKKSDLLENFIKEEIDDEYVLQTLDFKSSEMWTPIANILGTIGAQGKFKASVIALKKEYSRKYQEEEENKNKKEVPKFYNFFNHKLVS